MTALNLPLYPVRLSGTRERPTIFDVLRRKYVALTPEEWVRQHFVHFLTDHKGYPQSLLANEVVLRTGGKVLRADTVVYDTQLQPRMIVEYKAPTVAVTRHTFEQIATYNRLLDAGFLVVSNGLQHYCCRLDSESQSVDYLPEIPNYKDIQAK